VFTLMYKHVLTMEIIENLNTFLLGQIVMLALCSHLPHAVSVYTDVLATELITAFVTTRCTDMITLNVAGCYYCYDWFNMLQCKLFSRP
jgi:hypothetical protein